MNDNTATLLRNSRFSTDKLKGQTAIENTFVLLLGPPVDGLQRFQLASGETGYAQDCFLSFNPTPAGTWKKWRSNHCNPIGQLRATLNTQQPCA